MEKVTPTAETTGSITPLAIMPAGRALVEAAAQRRVGAPVFLRYAFEIGPEEDVVAHAAAATVFAGQVLGGLRHVYAIATPSPGRGGATPGRGTGAAHLAITAQYQDGSTALLGVGRRPPGSTPAAPSVLLLGDQGALEPYPPGAGALGPPVAPAGEPPAEACAAVARAIVRALASGQPEPVDGA